MHKKRIKAPKQDVALFSFSLLNTRKVYDLPWVTNYPLPAVRPSKDNISSNEISYTERRVKESSLKPRRWEGET